jgi:hypothetical protein
MVVAQEDGARNGLKSSAPRAGSRSHRTASSRAIVRACIRPDQRASASPRWHVEQSFGAAGAILVDDYNVDVSRRTRLQTYRDKRSEVIAWSLLWQRHHLKLEQVQVSKLEEVQLPKLALQGMPMCLSGANGTVFIFKSETVFLELE